MCLSSPSGANIICKKQQTYIIRDFESKRIISTYKATAKAVGNVKTYAYVIEPGMIECITPDTDVACLASSIRLSLLYNNIPYDEDDFVDPDAEVYRSISSVIVNRADGSVVLGFKLSIVSNSNELPKECLKSLFQNIDSEKLQMLLFGCTYVKPHTDDDLDNIFQDENVRDFFDELLEAICGKWVLGKDLLFVVPDKSQHQSIKRQRSSYEPEWETKINLVFEFGPDANKFPMMGFQHNHSEEREEKSDHWFVTNIPELDPKVPDLKLTEKSQHDCADDIANSHNIGVIINESPLRCFNLKYIKNEPISIGW